MSAQNRAEGSAPAPAEGLDLTAAVEAATTAHHGHDGPCEDADCERALRNARAIVVAAVQAAAPHVLRAAAERAQRQAEAALADASNAHRFADGDRRHFAAQWLRALAHEVESGSIPLADEIGGGRG